jgi:phytoene/squalene synthetase
MPDKSVFDQISYDTSCLTTKRYSTSFSLAIRLLGKRFREPIYNVYGFVRFADEIVDSFHGYDKSTLLRRFEEDTFLAIDEKISLNPILNSFQQTVNKYEIDHSLIHTFLKSMRMDLDQQQHDKKSYDEYILGSAEVVGLMCLRIFCDGDHALYETLTPAAMKLGSAFQKINFLRDLKEDTLELNRCYFPELSIHAFNSESKRAIENDIDADFHAGFEGIKKLPKHSRFGVYLAFIYYRSLYRKIQALCAERVLKERIRIPDSQKMVLLATSYIRHNLNLL